MERRGPARSNCGYDGAHGLAGAGAGAGDSSFMAPHLPTYSRSPGTKRPTPLSLSIRAWLSCISIDVSFHTSSQILMTSHLPTTIFRCGVRKRGRGTVKDEVFLNSSSSRSASSIRPSCKTTSRSILNGALWLCPDDWLLMGIHFLI
jgi:hypothetical protein